MRVFAAGFNAHHQISADTGNRRGLTELKHDIDAVLLATWSTFVFRTDNAIWTTGHQHITKGAEIQGCHSAIGDHNGLKAALSRNGELYIVHESLNANAASILKRCETNASPSLSFLAMAGNGRVACILDQEKDEGQILLNEFTSFDAFQAWYQNEPGSDHDPKRHQVLGTRPRQLLAGTGMFAMLLESGDLYTWGDPRYQSLARSITADAGAIDADKPGLVDALAGLKLKKVCLGGWMGGAVSEDGAAYIWGAGQPGKPAIESILNLKSSREKVALVQLANGDDEEPDIVDMGIGSGHIALVTSQGDAYVAGENDTGQLGLMTPEAFVDSWVKIPGVSKVAQIICGPRSTIAII